MTIEKVPHIELDIVLGEIDKSSEPEKVTDDNNDKLGDCGCGCEMHPRVSKCLATTVALYFWGLICALLSAILLVPTALFLYVFILIFIGAIK